MNFNKPAIIDIASERTTLEPVTVHRVLRSRIVDVDRVGESTYCLALLADVIREEGQCLQRNKGLQKILGSSLSLGRRVR